ncbi:prephenate dehydratase [Balneolaceae bacterium YR4-1]|uniref:Bifunctional chorismate mutase/prephenate dehydratase n=1 Tax=Halalkalibaculum roseum TaxID=2709311 RepID=A0A6M1SPZ9_9BACT|nr:prephenate dehydratase [Halalkalibaculum roseum]NGP77179.1 prephenate dehydratase [Halalkalibaculum roseum]
MAGKLEKLRKLLDQTDERIVRTLAQRQELIQAISDLKIDEKTTIRDENREEELLKRITELAREEGLDRYFAEQIFKDIIHHSVRFQTHSLVDHHNLEGGRETVSVAYQGTDGAFSHQAAYRHFEERYSEVECIGYDTFEEAARAVENEKVDYAILPIENTTAGSINQTYDILGEGKLHIVGEEAIRIIHCLLAIEKVPIERIKRIISHPQALAQCSHFLSKLHRCKVESYLDTAMSAKKVVDDGDLSQAAIAGSYAAQLYGLEILKRDLANQSKNFTRFVIVSRDEISVDTQIPCKTSLLMTTSHDKGSLISCLKVLEEHGINMAKLESRPKPNEPWKYLFYLDIEANTDEPETATALDELRKQADSLKVLGCYPAQVGKGGEQ